MSRKRPRNHRQEDPSQEIEGADRRVDAAMAEERPAKRTVRSLWLVEHALYDALYPNNDPLLVTLCGEEAREIRMLIEVGLIKLTEVGAIASESQDRVVAIERNPRAVLKLQKQYPGLKIIQQDFRALIGGDSLRRFPQREQEPPTGHWRP